MKLQYFPETDSLYIDLSERPSTESQEIAEGLVVDFDEHGRVVGLDIQHASEILSIDRLEAIELPTKNLKPAS